LKRRQLFGSWSGGSGWQIIATVERGSANSTVNIRLQNIEEL
jgi:hypothetical protein